MAKFSKDKWIESLCDRFGKLKAARGNWENYWSSLAPFVIPAEDEIHTYLNRTIGAEKNLRMYDSSAMHFNELLASAMHSMLTNAATMWFEITSGDPEIDKDEEARKHLQVVVQILHNIINNSNFHVEVHPYYLGLGSFGTSFLHCVEDDEDVVRFKNRHIFGAIIDTNDRGLVDTAFIPYKMTFRNVLNAFGEDALSKDQLKRMKDNMEEETTILLAILPRRHRDRRRKDAKNMPYATLYIWEEEKVLLKESGNQEQPFACSRWSVASEEKHGRSPAMKTLPDNRMLQQVMKTTIRGAQKMVDPPLMQPDDSFITPNTQPGGLNTFRAGTEDFIRPLLTGGNPNLGLDIMSDLRNRIKQGFYIDQLQLPQGPQKTATEVNALLQEQLKLFGPILGRQEHEFLSPIINRVLGIAKRKGLLPDPPEILAKANLTVRFSSQVAKAQRLAEIQSIDQFMMSVANVAQFKPGAIDYIDESEYVKIASIAYNAPPSLLKSKKDVEAEQKALAEQQQQQQQLDQAQQGATIAKDMAQTGG